MLEMGALALGSGAVVGGVFGMNLVSGLEEHPQGKLKILCFFYFFGRSFGEKPNSVEASMLSLDR